MQKVKLPSYTKGEEIFNWVGHCAGAALSVVALVIGIVFASIYNDARCVVSVTIYGVTMILLYTMSTLYHALKPGKAKKVFRIFDHSSIFLLIAGTYTPYTLVTLKEGWIGWALFGLVWGAAVLGVTLTAIDLHRFRYVNMACYILTGWCVIIAIVPLMNNLAGTGFALLLAGGIFYTLGAVLYGFGKRVKYIHSVWHLFVLAGSVLQFFSILLYVILA